MPRRATRSLWASLIVAAAACAPSAPTPAPNPGPSPSASAPASPASSIPAASTPLACAVVPQTGLLPSDRLVDLVVSATDTHDVITFVFEPSTPGPGGPPRGTLEAVQPPFTFAGSGAEIDLLGEHVVQVRFEGMTLASEAGDAVYRGPRDVKPDRPALREAIQYDAFEGVNGWYVGYDGPGCVTLARSGNTVAIMIAHSKAPTG